MAETPDTPSLKIQYEYQNPNNVESEVPGSQNIREVTDMSHVENADGAEIQNGGYTITRSFTEQSETVEGTKITTTTVTLSTSSMSEEPIKDEEIKVVSEKTQIEDTRPKTKIPKLKFRQAAERVKRDRRLTRGITQHETHIPVPTTLTKLSRHSKIPAPTAKPIVLKRDNEEAEVTRPDEEFDKIYEEIVENTQTEIEVEHPDIIETKFEEIIHDYDENKVQPINVEKIRLSRIPSLQRRSSEHTESKTVVVTERQKSRSLPRLKEISMRVKADDEVLGQTKYTRSISTENKEGGLRRIIETKITKNPEIESKISKIVTSETVTSGTELSKTIEGNSKSVTVQRTARVTSHGDVLDDIEKKKVQANILHTENIMKGSVHIAYPTFEAKIKNNTNDIRNETKICENTENESKYITYGENETVDDYNKSNALEGTSTVESNKQTNIAIKVSVNQLATNYDTVTGTKDIANSKILAEENAKSVEITEISPTIKRTMTISRVTSSSNDNEQLIAIESSKTPTTENESITSITEHKSIETRSKIPTTERHSTVARVESSNNDVNAREIQELKSSGLNNLSSVETCTTKPNFANIEHTQAIIKTEDQTVKQIEYTRTPIKETNGSFKNITTECTIVDVQKKSPTVTHNTSVTRIIESNNVKTKDIEYNELVKGEMDNNIEKDIPRKTVMTEISNQMSEIQDNAGNTDVNKKQISIETYEVENKTNVEELTTLTRKVGKLTHKTDSSEASTESTRKDQVDELPKKKSILSKIAMFERHDVDDRMPKKKAENLSKLVIKHSPQKVAHLHTPTIIEEVLKNKDNSPITINSNKDFSHLKSESAKSSSYILSPEIKKDGEYSQNVDLSDTYPDHGSLKSESIVVFDYKIKADEHKQTVELSKVNSISDYKLLEVKNVASEPEQNDETKKEMITFITDSSYDGSLITSELVSSVEHKVEADIEIQRTLNDKQITKKENSIISVNNRGDNAVTPKPATTYDYQFKGVNRLASEYERRREISKDTKFITRDVKVDSSLRLDPVTTMDYKFDKGISKHTNKINEKIDTSKQIVEITDKSNDNQLSLTPEPTMILDQSIKVDIKKPSIDYDRIIHEKNFKYEDKEQNSINSEAPTIEYTFKDVKKIATEFEQKVKFTKNLEVPSPMEPLSPTLLNYDSKYISKSNESLGKIMTDAPVILITPKSEFQTNTGINTEDDQVKISKIQAKDTVTHQAAQINQTELMKQISTEYKEAKINDKNSHTPNVNCNVLERSTSLKTVETKNLNNSTTINELNSTLTHSANKITAVNWVSKPTIDTKTYSKTKTTEITVIEPAKGDSSELKTTKLKGYVIKREGDLAYARIQEEAEFGDEIRTFSEVSKLPRTPVKETTSTITRRFKSVEENKNYYADVDINTVIKGKVSRMISRMTSVERQEADKKTIDIKEMPRKMSVLEKIAMFESKAAAGKTEYSYIGRAKVEKSKPQIHNMTQEEFEERVTELKSGRLLYGKIENMPNILLRNGVEMPVIALGTATLDTRLIPYIIGAAIDLGYRAIDTAFVYGNEKEIGDAIRAKIEDGTVRREDLFIISKLWNTFHRTDLVEKACRTSLEAMGLEYFDLYLIHNPMSFKEGKETIPKIATVIQYSQYDYLDAWYGMEKLMTKGLVRSIGVSNFNSVQLQTILDKGKMKPTVNQVECHPYLSQQKLDSFCEERDIKLSCYGVLGSKGTPAEYKSTLPPVIDDPLVQVMASGLNVSPAQLLIRYQLDSGRAAVVKTSSSKRLWDNLQALTFTLTQGQVEALQALNRNKRTFTFKGMGDTHKNYPFKISF